VQVVQPAGCQIERRDKTAVGLSPRCAGATVSRAYEPRLAPLRRSRN
jgi:hypothetical protein